MRSPFTRFAALFSLSLVAADKPKVLDAETFFDMETASNPAISPDGKLIVFSRGWSDKIKDQARQNLWVVNTDGTRLREMTGGNWRDSAPVWSPDGKRVAFLSDRDGTTQIHAMWADTKEVSQLTRLGRVPSELAWSPDSKRLSFTMLVPDDSPILPIALPKKPEGATWAKPATVIDRASWASDGIGPVTRGYRHVFVLDAEHGGTPRQATDGKFHHGGGEWSADGTKLFVSGIRKPEAEFARNDSEIYAVDPVSGAIQAITERKGPDRAPLPSPDGRWLAYEGYDDKRYTSHLTSLYRMHPSGDNKTVFATGLNNSPRNVIWAPDSSGIYFTVSESGRENIYFAPLNGAPKKLTDATHVLGQLSMSKTGQVAAIRTSFHEPETLVTFAITKPYAITAPMETRTLVDVNRDVLEGRRLGDVEELWVTAPDGLKVQGWLVKPVGFDAKKKHPLVLFIHGGPWSDYTVAFQWAWQNFAANGYAVLYMNPRGSTGYGQNFVNGIQYAYPGKDYDDLMAGVDAAIKTGYIDEKNLFVCGGSGGGVLTAWIVGHTDRFRAAVSMRPVIDWHSFVGTTDGVNWYDQFQKKPWEDPMEYAVRSPLHYVANVTTPTMVMTGEADLRTPMSQSEEFYRALKVLRKETLLVRMPDEFHGWRRPSHRLAQQLYLLAWFEKHRVKEATPLKDSTSQ